MWRPPFVDLGRPRPGCRPRIRLARKPTTVSALRRIDPPKDLGPTRIVGPETTNYRVRVRLLAARANAVGTVRAFEGSRHLGNRLFQSGAARGGGRSGGPRVVTRHGRIVSQLPCRACDGLARRHPARPDYASVQIPASLYEAAARRSARLLRKRNRRRPDEKRVRRDVSHRSSPGAYTVRADAASGFTGRGPAPSPVRVTDGAAGHLDLRFDTGIRHPRMAR